MMLMLLVVVVLVAVALLVLLRITLAAPTQRVRVMSAAQVEEQVVAAVQAAAVRLLLGPMLLLTHLATAAQAPHRLFLDRQ